MAKKDECGNLVTDPEMLISQYMKTYKHRLRHRKIIDEYVHIQQMKESLWNRRLENMKKVKTKPWTMENLDRALKGL